MCEAAQLEPLSEQSTNLSHTILLCSSLQHKCTRANRTQHKFNHWTRNRNRYVASLAFCLFNDGVYVYVCLRMYTCAHIQTNKNVCWYFLIGIINESAFCYCTHKYIILLFGRENRRIFCLQIIFIWLINFPIPLWYPYAWNCPVNVWIFLTNPILFDCLTENRIAAIDLLSIELLVHWLHSHHILRASKQYQAFH